MKIHILSLSWRDIRNPKKGGAEVQTHGMLKHLDKEKYEIVHISPLFPGALKCEYIDGIEYLRMGNIISVIFKAWRYYKRNCNQIDIVIDECNTHRFFTPFYVTQEKRIFLIYQLTREIWHINLKFPLDYIGFVMENLMLKIYKNTRTITESLSTKQELIELGFKEDKVSIIHIGISAEINQCVQMHIEKEEQPTFIYVGRYSAYKGIDLCIQAFAKVKNCMPNAKLWVVGKKDYNYISSHIETLCKSYDLKLSESIDGDVVLFGFVSEEEKYQLMKRAHLLLFPSLREGWGIIVTEAAMLGTPSIVSDSPGCIDAVNYGKAGYICRRSADSIADKIIEVMGKGDDYKVMQEIAFSYAMKFSWDVVGKDVNSYFNDFICGDIK